MNKPQFLSVGDKTREEMWHMAQGLSINIAVSTNVFEIAITVKVKVNRRTLRFSRFLLSRHCSSSAHVSGFHIFRNDND